MFGILASTFYSFSYIFERHLGAEGVHPFQMVFFRTAICIFLLVILTLSMLHGFRAKRPGKILLRGCLSAFGLLLWFYGLVHLPLAEATSLSLTTICLATLGAAFFLGEPVTRFRGIAILAALCGALAIIRPGVQGFQPEALAVLAAAACWGMAAVLVHSASRSEEPLTIALWTSAVITVFSLPAALPFWVWPIGWQ